MQGYAEGGSSLSRESVALVTANICAKALEDTLLTYRSQFGRKCPLLLGLNIQKDLADLTAVVKKLLKMNKFNIDSFRLKYFEMVRKPLILNAQLYLVSVHRFNSDSFKIAVSDKEGAKRTQDYLSPVLISQFVV